MTNNKKYSYYERKINYYETDMMQVVHHSNYARYLEETRIDMLNYYGIPFDMFDEMGYVIPVLDLKCRFIESLKYGETVKIVPKLYKMTPIKFYFSYKIYDESMTVVKHEAETSHCILNKEFKPVSLKKNEPEIYKRMLAMLDEGDKND